MEKRELTCICCPRGCMITVVTDGKNIGEVNGYTCRKGKEYAEKEVISPVRTVTSTVRVLGGERPLTSVKTKTGIPKDRILACMQQINGIVAEAPVRIGDVLLEDVAGTGVPIVATKAVRPL